MVPIRSFHRPEQSTWRLQRSWQRQAHSYLERIFWSTCLCPAVHATIGQVKLSLCRCLGIEHILQRIGCCSVSMLLGLAPCFSELESSPLHGKEASFVRRADLCCLHGGED